MYRILEGLEGVVVQMDNVFVFGSTKEEHDTLEEVGATLIWVKCEIFRPIVKFLGHTLEFKWTQRKPPHV